MVVRSEWFNFFNRKMLFFALFILQSFRSTAHALDQAHSPEQNTAVQDLQIWNGRIIPYVFGQSLASKERELIRLAMDDLSAHINRCVIFKPHTAEKDYVELIRGANCSTDVGFQGGRQTIFLAAECVRTSAQIQHQLLHTMGFYHEVSRPDRDAMLYFTWSNIKKEYLPDFDIIPSMPTFGLSYDMESLTHHPFTGFERENITFPTMVARADFAIVTLPDRMSASDILKIKMAYSCKDSALPFSGSKSASSVGGVSRRVNVPESNKLHGEEGVPKAEDPPGNKTCQEFPEAGKNPVVVCVVVPGKKFALPPSFLRQLMEWDAKKKTKV